MNYTFTDDPEAVEPVTLAEVKAWLKAEDFSADDTLLTDLITSVRQEAEIFCNRSFVKKSIVLSVTDFADTVIRLPFPEHIAIQSVTVDGIVTPYFKSGSHRFAVIVQGFGEEAVITYTAGSCSAAEKLALKRVIAAVYTDREGAFASPYCLLYPFKQY